SSLPPRRSSDLFGVSQEVVSTFAEGEVLRLDAQAVDYAIVALYFVFVLGIGLLARKRVSSSMDFFLSGRSLPAWVTGLAFISANLGAVEIMGMSANGAEIGSASCRVRACTA